MALTLPYPDMDFVPLDILTAAEQDQLVANIEYIANQFPVSSANIATGAVKSSNIDLTTLSGNTSSITLPAGTWFVIATVNCLIDYTGSFLSYVTWLGQTKQFQGYRTSNQNRNQVQFTYVTIISPSVETTYTVSQSGNAVDLYTPVWVAIKMN